MKTRHLFLDPHWLTVVTAMTGAFMGYIDNIIVLYYIHFVRANCPTPMTAMTPMFFRGPLGPDTNTWVEPKTTHLLLDFLDPFCFLAKDEG